MGRVDTGATRSKVLNQHGFETTQRLRLTSCFPTSVTEEARYAKIVGRLDLRRTKAPSLSLYVLLITVWLWVKDLLNNFLFSGLSHEVGVVFLWDGWFCFRLGWLAKVAACYLSNANLLHELFVVLLGLRYFDWVFVLFAITFMATV